MISKKQLFLKRIFDFIVSLMGLFFLGFPLIILIVIASCSTQSFGIFTQTRVGQHGNLFVIYKIKTMRNSNVAVNSELGKLDSFGITLQNDKRLTKFGKFLRRSKLDEIPQLLNVIKGDMSIIGPRPLLMEYLPLYDEIQKTRHDVRPGITGWAQVNGRNAISWKKKFELDIYYVQNISFLLDIKIFFKTIKKVIFSEDISEEGSATIGRFKGNK